jgi:Protein of unknown function (DUF3634)
LNVSALSPMQLLLLIFVAAFVGWVVWSICQTHFTFVVQMRNGAPGVTRGNVSNAFLQEIADVCRRHGVTEGVVRGVKKADRIGLTFSDDVPTSCQQQLRNLWNLSPRMSIAPARRSRN